MLNKLCFGGLTNIIPKVITKTYYNSLNFQIKPINQMEKILDRLKFIPKDFHISGKGQYNKELDKKFFSVNCSNEAKTSLSLPNHSNKEWILSVFDNQNVYRHNIYDKYFHDNNNLQFNNETEQNLIKFLKMYNLKVDNF